MRSTLPTCQVFGENNEDYWSAIRNHSDTMMGKDELPCQNSEYDWPQKCHDPSTCTGSASIPASGLPKPRGAGRLAQMRPRSKILRLAWLAGFVAGVIQTGMLLALVTFPIGCRESVVKVQFLPPARGAVPTGQFSDPFWFPTEFERIKSRSVLYPVIKNLKLEKKWGAESGLGRDLSMPEAYDMLLGRVNVRGNETNTIIEVFAKNKNLSEAREIANSIKSHYTEIRERFRRQAAGMDAPVLYQNAQYGLTFSLPAGWRGYSVSVE